MIEVKNLTKKYGNNTAVKDLSLKVEKGKIYGLLGANGAGKSTTMNIITGYIGATSGTVTIGDYDIVKNPVKAKKHIGYLPEIPPVYPDMRVSEYLSFVAELKKVPRSERKKEINRVMEATGLMDVKDKLIANLSKGYKQRTGLAAAITGSPDVIILDEPTVGLDPVQIIEIRNLIKSLSDDHAVILSSHILSEISEICDHIFIIANGKLVASNSTLELESQQANENKRMVKVTFIGEKQSVKELLDSMEDIEAYQIQSVKPVKSVVIDSEQEDEDESDIHPDDRKTDVLVNDSRRYVMVEISTSAEVDIREKLFYAAADAKLPIVAMAEELATLENVFIKMTKDALSEESDNEKDSEENEEDDLEDDVEASSEEDAEDSSAEDDSEEDQEEDSDEDAEEDYDEEESDEKAEGLSRLKKAMRNGKESD